MTVRVSKPEFNLREKISELDKPSGLKGTEIMRSETSQEARDLIGADRRNKIINGAMQVSQRGTSQSGITASGYKQAPDRFRINVSGPTITASQSTDSPDGFSNSYKIDITTADTSITGSDRLILQTRLEGQDLQDFAKGTNSAKDFIFSFYCKSTKMGIFTVELQDTDNTGSGGARSVSRHFTISNTGWNRYEINFGADTVGAFDNDNNKSIDIFFWLVAGPSYSGGSSLKEQWAAHIDNRRAYGTSNGADSTSNEFYFTGVQLEVGRNGGNATEFEHRSFAEELRLCYRYFVKMYGATATGGGLSTGDGAIATMANWTDTHCYGPIFMPVEMRIPPSLEDFSNLVYYSAGQTFTPSGSNASFAGAATNRVEFRIANMTNMSQGNAGWLRVGSSAGYISFNSEL